LRETLKTSKAIEIEFIDSFDVSVQNKGLAIGEIFQREDLSPVVCLGAAEEGLKPSLNLLPVEVQKRQRAAAEKGQYLRTAFLIALNLVLFFLIFFQAFYRDQLYLNDLNTRSLAMRSRVEGVKLKIQQLSEIERYVNPKVSTVDMIYSLYDMTPKEISFQLLSLDREGNLTIQGISEARTSVNDFHRNLTNSPLFKDASLQYAAQRRFFEGEITDFKITAVINQPKEP
jgi:Tfp pilus assembly protein PilN